jgi:hypothetical protein
MKLQAMTLKSTLGSLITLHSWIISTVRETQRHSREPELTASPSPAALEEQLRDKCEKGIARLDSHDKLFGRNDQSLTLREAFQQKGVTD